MKNIEEIILHLQNGNSTPLEIRMPIIEIEQDQPSIYIHTLKTNRIDDLIGYYRIKEWTYLDQGKWKVEVSKKDLMILFTTAEYLKLDYHYEIPTILDGQSYTLLLSIHGESEKRKYEWSNRPPKGCADLGIIANQVRRMAGI